MGKNSMLHRRGKKDTESHGHEKLAIAYRLLCHLSNFFSSPPIEVKHTRRALQTDSPVLTNVVAPDY